jgi:peptidoglycan/LPS O-acetylase OafA/YrhL
MSLGEVAQAGFPPQLQALTSLRFFLALGVVLFHLHLGWRYDDMAVTWLFERGRLGVDVFFILSGFVLMHVYAGALEARRFSYRAFLTARVARIFPVHLLALAGMLIMVLAAEFLKQDYRSEHFTAVGFLKTLVLVQAWFPASTLNEWNGPSWSLSAEWLAYLAFPVFAWVGFALRRWPWMIVALATVLFVGLDAYYRFTFGKLLTHAEENLGILRIVPEFLLGIGLYQCGRRLILRPAIAALCAGASVVAMTAAMHLGLDDRLIVPLAGALVLSLALFSKTQANKDASGGLVPLLGEASYALYLTHIPLFTAWRGIVAALTDRPSSYQLGWIEAGAMLVTAQLVAIVLFIGFERPVRDWIKSRLGRTASPRSNSSTGDA